MNEAQDAGTTTTAGPELPAGAIEVRWKLVVPEVDIHVVGYGNRLPNDFTLELLAVLKSAKRIFGAPPIDAPEFGIAAMEDLLALGGDGDGADRDERMAATVLEAAAADPPVALATWGSPMVGSRVAHRVVELAAQRGLTVHVTNAVPPFDAVWADLNIEPFSGFAIWDAATFVRRAIEPNPNAHLLLSQATAQQDGAALGEHLLRFYPPELEVHLLDDQPGVGPHLLATGIESVALGELGSVSDERPRTLVVPRAAQARLDFARSVPAAAG